jgi:uncharacterized protein DUF3323
MSGDADERLQRLLGGDALAGLRRRLRRHFERADPSAPSGTIRLASVAAHEYEALARLIGRRTRQASSIQIDTAAVDANLSNAGIAPSLRAALERLDGPIAHLPTLRAETAARWAEVAGDARHPGLAQFLQSPAGLGLLKRLARQDAEAAARPARPRRPCPAAPARRRPAARPARRRDAGRCARPGQQRARSHAGPRGPQAGWPIRHDHSRAAQNQALTGQALSDRCFPA